MLAWKLKLAVVVDSPRDAELLDAVMAQVQGFALEREFFLDWGAARAALKQAPYDAVLVDLVFGDTSGVEIIEYLRHGGEQGPMIVLCEPGHEEMAVDALHRGADDYLRLERLDGEAVRRSLVRALAQSTLRLEKAKAEEALRASEAKYRRLADELAEANRRLSLFVTQDALTGLANRRRFDEVLESEFRRAARNGDPLALLFCDVDYFKCYNDTFGHPAGDECLRRVGALLGGLFRREGELAARYGGEEFIVILPRVGAGEAFQEGERLRAALEALQLPHQRPDGLPWVTMSVGVASLTVTQGLNRAELVESADQALLAAKARGRNRVELAAEVIKVRMAG